MYGKREKRNQRGFTLAEMLIVVAIIGVLVSISVPVFTNKLEKAREAADISNMRTAKSAAVMEYLDGSLDWEKEDFRIFYYSASEGVLKTDPKEALPAYGQGTAAVDGGLRFDSYNETSTGNKTEGTDAKGRILKVTVRKSDGAERDSEGIVVEMEWIEV